MKNLTKTLEQLSKTLYEDDGDFPEFETEEVAYYLYESSKEIKRLKTICTDNGICTDCGKHWEHHLDEPFASCDCKTGE